uniref:Uncharacterized protein n=1 Tax=Lepeophtheirus salmonis TaxID=72036 RepID=A0A0K2URV1_LEPSM
MHNSLLRGTSSSLPDLRQETEELDLILQQLNVCEKRGFKVPCM